MIDSASIRITVGLTAGDGAHCYSPRELRRILADFGFAHTLSQAEGSEGTGLGYEECSVIHICWKPRSYDDIVSSVDCLNRFVSTTCERLDQRWLLIEAEYSIQGVAHFQKLDYARGSSPLAVNDVFPNMHSSYVKRESSWEHTSPIVIQGTHSYLISQFTTDLLKHPFGQYAQMIVTVSNQSEGDAVVSGNIKSASVDGYIRTLILDSGEGFLQIGGENATKEQLAAKSLSVALPGNVIRELAQIGSPIALSHAHDGSLDLNSAFSRLPRQVAIIVASRMPDAKSVKFLLSLLMHRLDENDMNHLCESFRSMRSFCRHSEQMAQEICLELVHFLDEANHQDRYSLAQVYAIETLGYIAGYHKVTMRMVEKYLVTYLQRNVSNSKESHHCWAATVALENLVRTATMSDRDVVIMTKLLDSLSGGESDLVFQHTRNSIARILAHCRGAREI